MSGFQIPDRIGNRNRTAFFVSVGGRLPEALESLLIDRIFDQQVTIFEIELLLYPGKCLRGCLKDIVRGHCLNL